MSRSKKGAFGHEPRSRWCESPVALTKARLQKGHPISPLRWIRELRCYRLFLNAWGNYMRIWKEMYIYIGISYHLDAVGVGEGAFTIRAMVMIIDDMLINHFFGGPCLITQGTIMLPMIRCIHVLDHCGAGSKIAAAPIAFVHGLAMGQRVHMLLPRAESGEFPRTSSAVPSHCKSSYRSRPWWVCQRRGRNVASVMTVVVMMVRIGVYIN